MLGAPGTERGGLDAKDQKQRVPADTQGAQSGLELQLTLDTLAWQQQHCAKGHMQAVCWTCWRKQRLAGMQGSPARPAHCSRDHNQPRRVALPVAGQRQHIDWHDQPSKKIDDLRMRSVCAPLASCVLCVHGKRRASTCTISALYARLHMRHRLGPLLTRSQAGTAA